MLAAADVSVSDSRLRHAGAHGIGVVAEFGGKVLSRGAAKDASMRLGAILTAENARSSDAIDASEAAVRALGKLLVHRAPAVDSAALLPVWLSWLPLKESADEDARAPIADLCTMLEADAPRAIGADGSNLRQVTATTTRRAPSPRGVPKCTDPLITS